MKAISLLAIFDSHTPYLAFRLNAFQDAIQSRGLGDYLGLQVVLIGAEEASYAWEDNARQSLYKVPVTVLSPRFRGLGMRSYLHLSVPGCLWRLFKTLIKERPKLIFAGGYDRPESIFASLLGRLWGCKTGVWNDSKFNDSESYGKGIWLELVKSFLVGRYHFYLCPGRESVDYHRFLGGSKKLALTHSWDVVDNAGIGKLAADARHDEAISHALQVSGEYFLMPVRFVEKKNILGVIEAYDHYYRLSSGNTLPLVICGKGPQEEVVRRCIAGYRLEEHIHLVPWLTYEQIPRACRRSRAVVLASTHDQWGMIVNEALAAGAPVLVSNRCGAHELVRNHINGFTFDPYDLEHLGLLFKIMTEKAGLVAHMRQEAAASVEHFSIERWLDRHFEVLQHFGFLEQASSAAMEVRGALS